jgi:hypothetical protein
LLLCEKAGNDVAGSSASHLDRLNIDLTPPYLGITLSSLSNRTVVPPGKLIAGHSVYRKVSREIEYIRNNDELKRKKVMRPLAAIQGDAMKMVGHKTESIYRCYAIADEKSMSEAAAKIDQLHARDQQPRETTK